MAQVWRGYLRVLQRYPLATQSTTTGTLMLGGDVIAQLAVEKRDSSNYDYIRSLRFLLFGQFVAGPILRGWYVSLDKLYKGSGKMTALLKVATDQAVFAPSFLTFFLSSMAFMRRESFEEIKEKVKRDIKPVLLTNYKIWPAVQIVNFYFVPLHHRVLVVNIVALGWNTYLAWAAEKPDTDWRISTALLSGAASPKRLAEDTQQAPSPSHIILTPGQPVAAQTPIAERQAK